MPSRVADHNDTLPSNRSFGGFFASVFAGAFLHGWWIGHPLRTLWLFLAVLFALLAIFAPRALSPLNRGWHALGLLLGRITGPLVLGLIFFLLITPVAFFARLAGRDALRLRARPAATYWVCRDQKMLASSFKRPF